MGVVIHTVVNHPPPGTMEPVLGHAIEGREGMDGNDALAVGPPAEPNGRDDLLVRPAADAGLTIRRDIGRVDGPKGPFELLAPRIELALGLRMAAAAAGGAEDVLATGDLGWIGGKDSAGPPGHEAGREEKSAHGSILTQSPARRFPLPSRLSRGFAAI